MTLLLSVPLSHIQPWSDKTSVSLLLKFWSVMDRWFWLVMDLTTDWSIRSTLRDVSHAVGGNPSYRLQLGVDKVKDNRVNFILTLFNFKWLNTSVKIFFEKIFMSYLLCHLLLVRIRLNKRFYFNGNYLFQTNLT